MTSKDTLTHSRPPLKMYLGRCCTLGALAVITSQLGLSISCISLPAKFTCDRLLCVFQDGFRCRWCGLVPCIHTFKSTKVPTWGLENLEIWANLFQSRKIANLIKFWKSLDGKNVKEKLEKKKRKAVTEKKTQLVVRCPTVNWALAMLKRCCMHLVGTPGWHGIKGVSSIGGVSHGRGIGFNHFGASQPVPTKPHEFCSGDIFCFGKPYKSNWPHWIV